MESSYSLRVFIRYRMKCPLRVICNMKEIKIDREPVELYKLLKFESIVSSGGEAKHVISERMVVVNGEVETRKRKKMVSGDTVEFNGELFRLRLV